MLAILLFAAPAFAASGTLHRSGMPGIGGEFEGITEEGSVLWKPAGSQSALSIPGDDVTQMKFDNAAEDAPFQLEVALAKGDVIRISNVSGDALTLTGTNAALSAVSIPWNKVKSIRNPKYETVPATATGNPDSIVVRDRHGRLQTLSGEVFRIVDGNVEAIVERQRLRFPLSGEGFEFVRAERHIREANFPELPGLYGEFALTDGSVVGCKIRSATSDAMVVTHEVLALTSLEVAKVLHVSMHYGGMQWLSDTTLESYRWNPAIGRLELGLHPEWQMWRDRFFANAPLTVRGISFRKGVALHATSLATFRVDGAFHKLLATVGVPDSCPDLASVIVGVRVDDDPAAKFESEILTKASEPLAIAVDVMDAQVITISVHAAGDGDRGDWCVFGDARLILTERR
ncbi:MAG: NPCBM/NEW2 domain-containing protein [Planctomycetes bacterium]|nr:NPCBM/NEW2 domain-containing protein [Planctomycetota bacterium]